MGEQRAARGCYTRRASMAPLTLVVMAAGIGSRFGGLKQIEPAGPSGETLLDYSVFDALRAGFERVVFVIRREIEGAFRESVLRRFEGRVELALVHQELDQLPAGFAVPAGRVKPWGTGHAALAAEPAISGPFALINADDFYGAEAFSVLARHFRAEGPAAAAQALVVYRLDETLSDHGGVARGVCRTCDGWLLEIEELFEIERGEGGIRGRGAGGWRALLGDEPTSMNFWGFQPAVLPLLRERFVDFLGAHGGDLKAEFLVPSVVNALVGESRLRVRAPGTGGRWFGVTHRDDLPRVRREIATLVARGEYPTPLFG
jgi:choline kinase